MFRNRTRPVACTVMCQRALPRAVDPLAVYDRLREDGLPWLLDSALRGRGPRTLGRHSFAGADPYLALRAFGSHLELEVRRAVRSDLPLGRSDVHCDPFDAVRALMPPLPDLAEAEIEAPFAGGVVGYWGYELAQWTEPVRLRARNDLGLPDLALLFIDRLFAFDHVTHRASVIGLGFGSDADEARDRAEQAADELAARVGDARELRTSGRNMASVDVAPNEVLDAALPSDLECGFDEAGHAKAVASIQDEIVAGNVYQANFTQRMERRFEGDVFSLYQTLRRLNPAPFSACLELPEVAILSSSPERFLRVDGQGGVESRPIKGTRPRSGRPEQDAANARELEVSEKDRAENLMIVDLVRNDLGRVCEIGSIEVPELRVIEPYATVFQMVSTVAGRLARGRDVTDLLRAAFPPGSMTGAPKIAAMKLLDRLEPVRRSVYSGAIGYLDVRGGADLSVVIRTLLVVEGRALVHAGGGVVADSDPIGEYYECLDKARALLSALEMESST